MGSTGRVIAVVVCLAVIGVAGGAGAQADPVRITTAGVTDDSVVTQRGAVAFLWASDGVTVTIELESTATDGEGSYDVCLGVTDGTGGSGEELSCETVSLTGGETERVQFSFDEWPAATGVQTLQFVVRADTLQRDVVATANETVRVLDRSADPDGDGLANDRELSLGTDIDAADTDGDGLSDGLEVGRYDTDPTATDSDGDSLSDGREVSLGTSPTATDTDGDGLSDREEVEVHGTDPTAADTDGDGLADPAEIERGTQPTNPDTDGDGLADGAEIERGTDPTAADTDDDGLSDALELLTYDTDPTAADTDGDGLADGDEVFEHGTDPATADSDGDGLSDGEEVTEFGTDPTASDTDGDGAPDARELRQLGTNPTDPDTNGDGVADGGPGTPTPGLPVIVGGLLTLVVSAAALYATRGLWLHRVPSEVRARIADSPVATRVGGVASRAKTAAGELRGRGGAAVAALAGRRPDPEPSASPASAPDTPQPNDVSELDLETMAKEDAVRAVLAANGGRMRQSEVVDETGWSKATVSRVLSRMADDDEVTKINVGRGNVVALPGAEPPGVGSPFEEDE